MSFMFGDEEISNIEMSAYVDSDIPSTQSIVTASMDDWELPNQIIAFEAE